MLAREEVFIDAQHGRTQGALTFAAAQLEEVVEPTFDGGAADPLPFAQTAAADTVPVLQRDATPEWFGGSFPGQNSGKSLPESAIAILTTPFVSLQFHPNMPHAPTFVA